MQRKQRVKYETSRRNIDLLKKYYPVDEEDKTVTVCFHYDTAEELYETQVNPDCAPQLQPELLDQVHETIHRIPWPYRLKIQLKLDDFQGHRPEAIVESFSDSLEFMRFSKRAGNSRMLFLSAMLVIVGYFILGMMVVGQELGWFGSDFIASITEEVVDIAGWVFLWEAVTILFLESSERSVSDPGIRKRIAALAICNAEGTVQAEKSHDELFRTWGHMDKVKSVVRHCLLISGCAFILFGLNGFFYLLQLETLLEEDAAQYMNLIRLVMGTLSLCQILAGVGGFYRFFGRRNLFTGFSRIYAFFMCFMIGIYLVFSLVTMEFRQILMVLGSWSSTLLFVAAVILDGRISKNRG